MPTPEEEFKAFRQQEHASFDSFRSEIGKDFEGFRKEAHKDAEEKDTRILEAKLALAKYAEQVRDSTNWVQTEQVVEAQPAFKALETGSAGPAVKAEQVVEAQPAVKAVETGSAGPAVKSEVVQAMVLRKMLGRY